MEITYTQHAKEKIAERNIPFTLIEMAVNSPDIIEADKFDEELTHYIKKFKTRFLRVIARKENAGTFIVISVFYDRRMKRRLKK